MMRPAAWTCFEELVANGDQHSGKRDAQTRWQRAHMGKMPKRSRELTHPAPARIRMGLHTRQSALCLRGRDQGPVQLPASSCGTFQAKRFVLERQTEGQKMCLWCRM